MVKSGEGKEKIFRRYIAILRFNKGGLRCLTSFRSLILCAAYLAVSASEHSVCRHPAAVGVGRETSRSIRGTSGGGCAPGDGSGGVRTVLLLFGHSNHQFNAHCGDSARAGDGVLDRLPHDGS
jgi:hypothetical protein